jgi:hypothetical protein
MITVEKICFLTVTEYYLGRRVNWVLPRRSSKSLMAVSQWGSLQYLFKDVYLLVN